MLPEATGTSRWALAAEPLGCPQIAHRVADTWWGGQGGEGRGNRNGRQYLQNHTCPPASPAADSLKEQGQTAWLWELTAYTPLCTRPVATAQSLGRLKDSRSHYSLLHQANVIRGNSLVVQWLTLCAPNAEGPGSILDPGTGYPMSQLRVCLL